MVELLIAFAAGVLIALAVAAFSMKAAAARKATVHAALVEAAEQRANAFAAEATRWQASLQEAAERRDTDFDAKLAEIRGLQERISQLESAASGERNASYSLGTLQREKENLQMQFDVKSLQYAGLQQQFAQRVNDLEEEIARLRKAVKP